MLLFFWTHWSVAQEWVITRLAPIPEPVTNNAISEGFIGKSTYVYSFGGLDSTKLFSGIHQRCYRLDLKSGVWGKIPDLPDSLGKIAMAASRIGNVIYIIGGYHVFSDGSERSSNKVHRFDISSNRFVTDGSPLPLAIDDHVQAVWKDSLIYVITGWSDKQNEPNVQIYNPALDQWTNGTPVPDNNDFKSFGASGTIVGNTIYYFGGAAYEKYFPIQNQLRLGIITEDPSEITWSVIIPDPQVFGYRMASTMVKGNVFWFGGSAETYNYDGIQYETKIGVRPANRFIKYGDSKKFELAFDDSIPMDLRGIAEISDDQRVIVGGMGKNQKVLNNVLLIELK